MLSTGELGILSTYELRVLSTCELTVLSRATPLALTDFCSGFRDTLQKLLKGQQPVKRANRDLKPKDLESVFAPPLPLYVTRIRQ